MKFICPFCFTRNNLYEVKFRCINSPGRCAQEPDEKHSKFLELSSPQLLNKVIQPKSPETVSEGWIRGIPKQVTCPSCNEISHKRICQTCHSELPDTLGDYKDLIFAVIGAKEAGKSHYIGVLIDQIIKQLSGSFNWNLEPLNDATIRRYRDDFYKPIFDQHIPINATKSARADVNVRTPLIYTLSFWGKNWLGQERVSNLVTLVFFDTAGEDLDAEDLMRTENKYIYNATGIVLLLDPLQLDAVRDKLPKGVPLPKKNTESEDILTRVARLIRSAKGLKATEAIDIPLAVTFSKMDALDSGSLLDLSSNFKADSKHQGHFNLAEFNSVNTEMETLVREWSGGGLLAQLQHNFKRYAFFGVSALGCNPHGTNKIDKVIPRRVSEPLLWLLWLQGLIHDENWFSKAKLFLQRNKFILFTVGLVVCFFLFSVWWNEVYRQVKQEYLVMKWQYDHALNKVSSTMEEIEKLKRKLTSAEEKQRECRKALRQRMNSSQQTINENGHGCGANPEPQTNDSTVSTEDFPGFKDEGFPKDSCGDDNPGGINQWYPVWVDYSRENLKKIRSHYCLDAFRKTNDNIIEIQVASFLSESTAEKFAQFMREVMGSGRVGEMTER